MINTIETNGAVVLPSTRNNKPIASPRNLRPTTDPVVDDQDTDDCDEPELKARFQADLKSYAAGFKSLRATIDDCLKAGVERDELVEWAEEIGFARQTLLNVFSAINKENGLSTRDARDDDDGRLAENKDKAKADKVQLGVDYLTRIAGSSKDAESLARAILRKLEKINKAAKSEDKASK